ncbi:MAG: glutathione S-transferase family protein [Enhygromyxa sp.]
MPSFQLISAHTCPFVQRSAITLNLKQVEYETRYVDLGDKPAWFLELSPLGKVPLLLVREGEREDQREIVLFESAVINEYLDEVTEGSLLPADPLLRARHRGMIELASACIADAWRMGVATSEADSRAAAEALRGKLARFEAELVGPFFTGEELSLVDTASIPMLQRAAWTDELRPELEVFAGLPRVRGWLEAAEQLDAVRRSTVEDIRERYWDYLAKREGSWVGAAVSR